MGEARRNRKSSWGCLLPAAIPAENVRQLLKEKSLGQEHLTDLKGNLIPRSTVQKLVSGRQKTISKVSLERFAAALDVTADYLLRENPSAPREPNPKRSPPDRKNRIATESLSRRLLARNAATPSFAECVKGSLLTIAKDSNEKDNPLRGWTYNHFFQAAATIYVVHEGGKREVVVYQRTPRAGIVQYEHTRGVAMLWGASFSYSQPGIAPQAMDKWIDDVDYDPVSASQEFTCTRGSVLTKLLQYKVDLTDVPVARIMPFAVLTRDERTSQGGILQGRVYTAYAFELLIERKTWKTEVEPTWSKRASVYPYCWPVEKLEQNTLETRFCDVERDTLSLMDILAWRAIFDNDRVICDKSRKATLKRGFELV
ncbi:MAG TPA: hypothetical protein VMY37_18110 [Thermoguttaceae bacterium]|nr:hypothetical protein [Thermoguttaceae bacterium]